MAKQISPNDFVALPVDIAKSLHGIIKFLWARKVDFLIFELCPLKQIFRRAKPVQMSGNALGAGLSFVRDDFHCSDKSASCAP
jgi:hypothetical protein